MSQQQEKIHLDFDHILHHVGSFGRYQKLLLLLMCIAGSAPSAFHYMNQVFMSATPAHWCHVPKPDTLANWTEDAWRKYSVPTEVTVDGEKRMSQCSMYDVNWTEIARGIAVDSDRIQPNNSWPQTSCKHGWIYDHSIYERTIVTDWDIVCSKDFLPDLALSMSVLGNVIGSLLFGIIGDKYGRRMSFFVCIWVMVIFGTLTAFMPEFISWTVIRVFVGFTVPASFQIPFIIALELMAPAKRTFASMIMCVFFGLGMMLLGGVAAAFTDWIHLALVTAVPMVLLFGIWYVIPESPRWLLVNNRVDEVEEIVQHIAKKNGRQIPPKLLAFLEEQQEELLKEIPNSDDKATKKKTAKQPNISQLFKSQTPYLRKKSILITLSWSANVVGYIGLTFIVTRLRINDFIATVVSGGVEVPAYVLPMFLLNRVGRKWPLVCSMIIGGISLLCIAMVPNDEVMISFVLAMIGKFGISMSFAIIYQYAGELLPTQLRAAGLAFCGVVAGILSVVAPYILYLSIYGYYVPLVILGSLAIGGALAALPLPETLNQHLPQTVQEAEEFGQDQSYCYCLTLRKTPKLSHVNTRLGLADQDQEQRKMQTEVEKALNNNGISIEMNSVREQHNPV